MTQVPHAELAFILDRSGSMQPIWSDAIGGYNAFVAEQRELSGSARLTFAAFDDHYVLVHDGVPLDQVPELRPREIRPRGRTALLDAIGLTLARLEARAERQEPGAVIVAIMTDGLENASQAYTRAAVKTRIQRLRQEREWQFLFLAANQDAIAAATRIGIDRGQSVGFESTAGGTQRAMRRMSRSMTELRISSGLSDRLDG